MNGILFLIWLIIVVVVALLVVNYGGKLSSGVGLGLVVAYLALLITHNISNDEEHKNTGNHGTFITFGFLMIITLIYLALYVVYRNAVELGKVKARY